MGGSTVALHKVSPYHPSTRVPKHTLFTSHLHLSHRTTASTSRRFHYRFNTTTTTTASIARHHPSPVPYPLTRIHTKPNYKVRHGQFVTQSQSSIVFRHSRLRYPYTRDISTVWFQSLTVTSHPSEYHLPPSTLYSVFNRLCFCFHPSLR